jgi:glutathione S-transferase
MAKATLTISSKNYSSWSLRGWLLTKFSGLDFEEIVTAPDDPSARAEILLLSSSILVPCLRHDGAVVWDTLAIAEYLNEAMPSAGLLPDDRVQRAHCRSICGEIHSGFTTLRASLPVNLKGHFPGFKIWSRAQADIDRVWSIWRDCLARQSERTFSRLQDLVARPGRHRPGLVDLARLPGEIRRPVPVRRAAHHGGCDVRARGDALRHL